MSALGLMAGPAAAAIATTVAAGGLLHGAFHRNSPVFGRVLKRLPGSGRRVALTFDDGPNVGATPLILDTLAHYRVPATFFVLGAAARIWPDLVRRMVDERHQIGNHGNTHRKLHLLGPSAVRSELRGGAVAIEKACGVRPRYFRAPHGFRSPWVSVIAASQGESTVGWSLGVWDSDRPGEDVIAERVLRGVQPGSIILLHDGDGYRLDGDRLQTARALPAIIEGLRARGYDFVGLPER